MSFKYQVLLTFAFLNFVYSGVTEAARIVQFKRTRMIIEMEGTKLTAGQKVQLVGPQNKVMGTLQIMSIKGTRALGKVLAGKPTGKEKIVLIPSTATADAGPTLGVPPVPAKVPAKPAAPVVQAKPEPPKPPAPSIPYRVSALLGLANNTLSLTVSDGITQQNVDNTGNSISLAVAADRTFKPWVTFRAVVGFEQFNAIGASTINGCAGQTSKDCQTDLKFISLGGYLKHEKVYQKFIVSAAVGLNGKIPIAKESTALVESSLGSTMTYGIALGADYVLETKAFIPFMIEKQFFIKSDTAEMNTLIIRTGVGKEF